jgi:ABC-type multidrug transport system fused ATPase/permease subunit
MAWFHANPAGRVINRFSKDIESIDQRLMPQVIQAVAGFGSLLSTIAIIAHSAPVLLAIIGPLVVTYYFILRFYRRSMRELKRLEARSRSPLQSKVNETLDGIPTIAAYGRCMDFASSAHYLIDESNKPVYLRTTAEIWATLRLEFLSAFVILAIAMLGKQTKVMNMSQFGSALSYANGLTFILNLLVKSTAAVESEVSHCCRVVEIGC